MPAKQFFVLNRQIPRLMKEEEARELRIVHHGEPGKRVRELYSEINADQHIRVRAESATVLVQRGDARPVAASEIEATRQRQRAVAEEIAQDRDAWLARLKEKIAAEQSNPSPPSPSSPDAG